MHGQFEILLCFYNKLISPLRCLLSPGTNFSCLFMLDIGWVVVHFLLCVSFGGFCVGVYFFFFFFFCGVFFCFVLESHLEYFSV